MGASYGQTNTVYVNLLPYIKNKVHTYIIFV